MTEEKSPIIKRLKVIFEQAEFFLLQFALIALMVIEVVSFLSDRIGINLSIKEILFSNINLLYISLGIIATSTTIILFFTVLLKRDIKNQNLKNKIIAVYIESIENSSINPKNN